MCVSVVVADQAHLLVAEPPRGHGCRRVAGDHQCDPRQASEVARQTLADERALFSADERALISADAQLLRVSQDVNDTVYTFFRNFDVLCFRFSYFDKSIRHSPLATRAIRHFQKQYNLTIHLLTLVPQVFHINMLYSKETLLSFGFVVPLLKYTKFLS